MKELCEARAKLEMCSNFQIYPGKPDKRSPHDQARVKFQGEFRFSDLPG